MMIDQAILIFSILTLGISILTFHKVSKLILKTDYILSEVRNLNSGSQEPDHYLNKRLNDLQRMRFSLIRGSRQE